MSFSNGMSNSLQNDVSTYFIAIKERAPVEGDTTLAYGSSYVFDGGQWQPGTFIDVATSGQINIVAGKVVTATYNTGGFGSIATTATGEERDRAEMIAAQAAGTYDSEDLTAEGQHANWADDWEGE